MTGDTSSEPWQEDNAYGFFTGFSGRPKKLLDAALKGAPRADAIAERCVGSSVRFMTKSIHLPQAS